jgi:hypothetical protein
MQIEEYSGYIRTTRHRSQEAGARGITSRQFETRVSYRKLTYYHHIYVSVRRAEVTECAANSLDLLDFKDVTSSVGSNLLLDE